MINKNSLEAPQDIKKSVKVEKWFSETGWRVRGELVLNGEELQSYEMKKIYHTTRGI
jgi:hypothetical protein